MVLVSLVGGEYWWGVLVRVRRVRVDCVIDVVCCVSLLLQLRSALDRANGSSFHNARRGGPQAPMQLDLHTFARRIEVLEELSRGRDARIRAVLSTACARNAPPSGDRGEGHGEGRGEAAGPASTSAAAGAPSWNGVEHTVGGGDGDGDGGGARSGVTTTSRSTAPIHEHAKAHPQEARYTTRRGVAAPSAPSAHPATQHPPQSRTSPQVTREQLQREVRVCVGVYHCRRGSSDVTGCLPPLLFFSCSSRPCGSCWRRNKT